MSNKAVYLLLSVGESLINQHRERISSYAIKGMALRASRLGMVCVVATNKANKVCLIHKVRTMRIPPINRVETFVVARFLDESSGNLAQYFGTQVTQTRQFPLTGRLARPHLGVHRLLQSHDG